MRLLNPLIKILFGILCAIGTIGFVEAGIHMYKIQQSNQLIEQLDGLELPD